MKRIVCIALVARNEEFHALNLLRKYFRRLACDRVVTLQDWGPWRRLTLTPWRGKQIPITGLQLLRSERPVIKTKFLKMGIIWVSIYLKYECRLWRMVFVVVRPPCSR